MDYEIIGETELWVNVIMYLFILNNWTALQHTDWPDVKPSDVTSELRAIGSH